MSMSAQYDSQVTPDMTSVRILTDSVLQRENERAWAAGYSKLGAPNWEVWATAHRICMTMSITSISSTITLM